MVGKIYDLYEDDFKLFGYRPDDALRIAKEKREKVRPDLKNSTPSPWKR